MHFTFTALDHVKKMNKRCVLVLSGASLFVGGEDVRRGSFCNKRTRFATFMLKAESSGCLKRVSMGWWLLRRGGGALGEFLGGYVPPRTPNWHPVLKKKP